MKKILTFLIVVTFLSLGLLTVADVYPIKAQTTVSLGVMSDSSSDEYRAEDNRAGATQWAATTLAWTELLAKYRSIDLGSWGSRSEPRRTGYEYNWARSGAEAADVVARGQHTGLAQQVQAGQIDIVYFQIGNNDFAYFRDGEDIYNGTISGAALDNKINTFLSDVRTALDTVLAANGQVKVILGNVPDPVSTPTWPSSWSDPQKKQRVSSAVRRVNDGLQQMVGTRSRVTYFDQQLFAQAVLSKVNQQGNLIIGGESISLTTANNNPRHFVLSDNIHGGTVAEGLFANEVIKLINQSLGTDIAEFSEQEILRNAGIAVSGVPTPTSTIRPTAVPLNTVTPTLPPDEVSPTQIPSTDPTATPNECPEDINDDSFIDLSDYSILAANFLADPLLDARTDIDGDGIADLTDYSRLVGRFLESCQ